MRNGSRAQSAGPRMSPGAASPSRRRHAGRVRTWPRFRCRSSRVCRSSASRGRDSASGSHIGQLRRRRARLPRGGHPGDLRGSPRVAGHEPRPVTAERLGLPLDDLDGRLDVEGLHHRLRGVPPACRRTPRPGCPPDPRSRPTTRCRGSPRGTRWSPWSRARACMAFRSARAGSLNEIWSTTSNSTPGGRPVASTIWWCSSGSRERKTRSEPPGTRPRSLTRRPSTRV